MSRTWEIASPHLRRTLVFDLDVGLYTSHLELRSSGVDLLAGTRAERRWTPEFSLRVGDALVTSLSPGLTLLEAKTLSAPLWVRLHIGHEGSGLLFTLDYHLHDRYPAVRKRVRVTNEADMPVTVTHVALETLPLELGTGGELQLEAHYGTQPRELLYTGRIDDPLLLVRNGRTGDCVFVLNEGAGHTRRIDHGAWFWDGFVRVGFDTDLFPFERQIAPGETWAAPVTALVHARETVPEQHPRRILPAYTAEVTARHHTRVPLWHYNTWDPFGIGIDEAAVMALIPRAARMGFEVFTIDDGWQDAYGDNTVSPTRFPGGLDRVRAAVEAHGMRLGLWASLAAVSPALLQGSPALAGQTCLDASGTPKLTMTAQGEQNVMCLASGYADAAAERLIDLVGRYNLAYLKLDLTTVFNAYGEAPGCHAPGHQHASAAESVGRIYEGIAAVCQRVHEEHPELLIDLTFELWGQKHAVDYALLQAGDLTWLSNVGDNTDTGAGPRQARLLLYTRALAAPVETLLIGNLRADTGHPDEKFATALGAAPLLLGDLRQLSDAQLDGYGEHIRWFRALRRALPLYESFYPLGAWRQPGVLTWDGFARLSASGEGVVVLFRNESDTEAAEVQVPLAGDGMYMLTPRLRGDDRTHHFTAAELRAGARLPFNGQRVRVLEMRREG